MAMPTENWNTYFKEFMNCTQDSRSKDWMFVESPVPLMTASVCYLYFVCVAGPRYMQHRKPYDLKKLITAYNLFQIGACSSIIYGMLTTNPITQFGCEAINHSDPIRSYSIARWTYWAALLKVTEFAETVFFVLRKKQNQITGLHLYHHVSTLTIGWITTKYYPGEATVLPVTLNAFIHVLMYSYYLIALYGGRKLQRKIIFWKKLLTILQMVQFTILIFHILISFRSHCPAPKVWLLVLLINLLINYVMFYRFYKKTYKKTV